jgi:ketosteroid isomerase-like protein
MSQENVELVRRGLDLIGRGDLAELVSLIGPEFELHENVLAPDAAVYRGPQGLREWLEAGQEAFADFRIEAERFTERGDWVFAQVRAYGRGKGSGAPFKAQYVIAVKLRLGEYIFGASYQDLPEALEAVGLSE